VEGAKEGGAPDRGGLVEELIDLTGLAKDLPGTFFGEFPVPDHWEA
jgi:hypothetical protein